MKQKLFITFQYTSTVVVYLFTRELNLLMKSLENSVILFFFLSIYSQRISTTPLFWIKYIAKSRVSGWASLALSFLTNDNYFPKSIRVDE